MLADPESEAAEPVKVTTGGNRDGGDGAPELLEAPPPLLLP